MNTSSYVLLVNVKVSGDLRLDYFIDFMILISYESLERELHFYEFKSFFKDFSLKIQEKMHFNLCKQEEVICQRFLHAVLPELPIYGSVIAKA